VNVALQGYVQERLAGEVGGPGRAAVRGPVVPWKGRRHGRRRPRRWARAWSPEQIARRLRLDFPEDETMRISHEAIYQALYVQGRGALRRELTACLRTGRALRVPRARSRGRGKSGIAPEILISQRPAEAEDRALQYACRWLSEDFHKALKTGMGAERLQLEEGHRAFAAVAIMSVVALRLIDFLLADENRETLRRQRILVMPNVSPDAAEADTYETPAGIKPNLDFGPDGQRSPEAAALRKVADALQPDVYVDIHARGHSGWSHDMVLFPPARPYTEDEHLLHTIATAMAAEGETSGIPHVVHPLTWPGWGGYDLNQPSSTLYMYRQFKSLVFLTENAESHDDPLGGSHTRETQLASGIGRLRPLLALGNSRSPQSFYNGYPIPPAVGMHHAGIIGIGKTAAERRRSRIAIWQQSDAFGAVAAVVPEKPGVKRLRVSYNGQTLKTGVGFQVRAAGHRELSGVSIDGRPLSAGEADGFFTWHDAHTTFAVAALPTLAPGEFEIVFQFR